MKVLSDVRTTYLYLVCFAMLLIAAIGVVRAGSVALDLLIYGESSPHMPEYRPSVLRSEAGDVVVPPALLEAQAVHEQQHRTGWPASATGLVAGLSLAAWGFPLYAVHWHRVRREETSASRSPVPWAPRPLYFYLVSAVALGMIVGGGHRAVVEAAGGVQSYVWSPGPMEFYERSVYDGRDPITVDQAIAEADRAWEQNLSYHRYFRWRRVAGGLLSLIVGLALYVPHWRWASRAAVS